MPEGKTALLVYGDVRKPDSLGETLLEFLESAYQAGAKTAGWDAEEPRAEPPSRARSHERSQSERG